MTQFKPLPIARRYGRLSLNCEAVLAFPYRHVHPRIKAHLFQIGKGGCGVSTRERLYIGEECLIWATAGGHKYLGVAGQVVWQKTVYEGQELSLVGIEFKEPIELTPDLLASLGASSLKDDE